MIRTRIEDDNPEFDRLRSLKDEYDRAQAVADAAGQAVRGEAARLARAGKKANRRGQTPAVGRVLEWTREYVSRLGLEVDDDGERLPDVPARPRGKSPVRKKK